MRDAVVAVVAILVLLLPFALSGLWWWVALIGVIAGVVAAFELSARAKSGKTLSQQFWAFKQQHPKTAWAIVGLLALAWAGLLVHLVWK